MASTNKTANLSLNQWVPTDPVLMEDMNEDNRKLDAMVGGLSAFTLLGKITSMEDAAQMDVNISTIDWAKYRYVIFELALNSNGGESYLTKIGSDSYRELSSSSNVGGAIGKLNFQRVGSLILVPRKNLTHSCTSIFFSGHNYGYGFSQSTYTNAKTLSLIPARGATENVALGSKITILGVK